MFEVVGKAERFDVLLQAGGDVSLVVPEAVAHELVAQGCEERLDLG